MEKEQQFRENGANSANKMIWPIHRPFRRMDDEGDSGCWQSGLSGTETRKQTVSPVRKDNPHPAQIAERQMTVDCRFCRTRAPKVCTAMAMVKKPPEKVPMAMNTANEN